MIIMKQPLCGYETRSKTKKNAPSQLLNSVASGASAIKDTACERWFHQ